MPNVSLAPERDPKLVQQNLLDKNNALLPPNVRHHLHQLALHANTEPGLGEFRAICLELFKRFPAQELREVPGPRFWQPNEPTILLAGEDVTDTGRHGHDGPLWVYAADFDVAGGLPPDSHVLADNFSKLSLSAKLATNRRYFSGKRRLRPHMVHLLADEYGDRMGGPPATDLDRYFNEHQSEILAWARADFRDRSTDGTDWHPLFLEWEVEVLPLHEGGNVAAEHREFAPSFIDDNFTLQERSTELSAERPPEFLSVDKDHAGMVAPSSTIFSGRSILTPHAVKVVRESIESFVPEQPPPPQPPRRSPTPGPGAYRRLRVRPRP